VVPTTFELEYGVGTQTQTQAQMYVAQGRHLVQTLKGCPSSLLDDEAFLMKVCTQAALATGAEILNVTSHHFDPQGVTIMILLSESHASIHTYPEVGVAFWDCFTCGWHCDPSKSVNVLQNALKPESMDWHCMTRGEEYES